MIADDSRDPIQLGRVQAARENRLGAPNGGAGNRDETVDRGLDLREERIEPVTLPLEDGVIDLGQLLGAEMSGIEGRR